MNTTDKNSALYETPELLELGKASTLTLGTNCECVDNCGCSYPKSPLQ